MTALFRGGEDSNFDAIGSPSVSTTSTFFRSAFARCALQVTGDGQYWRMPSRWGIVLPSTGFWFSARLYNKRVGTSIPTGTTGILLRFNDRSDTPRLQIRNASVSAPYATGFRLEKVNSVGSRTLLTTFSAPLLVDNGTTYTPQHFDVYVAYGTTGGVQVFADGLLVAQYVGDLTTDGNTSLAGFDLGQFSQGNQLSYWSEIIVDTDDTRSMSLFSVYPTAPGQVDSWNGTYADVSEITLNDLTSNYVEVGSARQLYAINTLFTDDYRVVDLTVDARASAQLTSVPQFMQLSARVGGAIKDAPATAIRPGPTRDRHAYTWAVNPANNQAWQQNDLTGLQIGLLSVVE